MIELINYIKKSHVCHKEEPLNVVDIIKTQKELVRMECPFLPADFIINKNFKKSHIPRCIVIPSSKP